MEFLGYPRQGTDWLRRQRMPIILGLAILAWCIFLFFGWSAYHMARDALRLIWPA